MKRILFIALALSLSAAPLWAQNGNAKQQAGSKTTQAAAPNYFQGTVTYAVSTPNSQQEAENHKAEAKKPMMDGQRFSVGEVKGQKEAETKGQPINRAQFVFAEERTYCALSGLEALFEWEHRSARFGVAPEMGEPGHMICANQPLCKTLGEHCKLVSDMMTAQDAHKPMVADGRMFVRTPQTRKFGDRIAVAYTCKNRNGKVSTLWVDETTPVRGSFPFAWGMPFLVLEYDLYLPFNEAEDFMLRLTAEEIQDQQPKIEYIERFNSYPTVEMPDIIGLLPMVLERYRR